jgi:signal transduction histidine kinase
MHRGNGILPVRATNGRGNVPSRASSGPYRGEDRRGVLRAERATPGPVFVTAGVVLVALTVLLVAVAPRADVPTGTGPLLTAQLDAASWAIALLLAGLCFVRWRLLGEAALLWLGVAAAVFGLFTFGAAQAITLGAETDALLWLPPASRLVVLGLVARALLAPDVDANRRPVRVVIAALAAVATLTVVLQLLPSASRLLSPQVDAAGVTTDLSPLVALWFVTAWLLLAVWSLVRGLRRRRHVFCWFALLFFAGAAAELVGALSSSAEPLPAAGAALLLVTGLLCAATGVTVELSRAYERQGGRLLESQASELTAEARARAEQEAQAERAHEARNALAAIDGAVSTLHRFQDRLDPETRAELSAAVGAEVQRLQRLVTVDAAASSPARFRVTEVLAAVVTAARSQGVTVTQDVPDHLVATGHPADTAQVLHNLFQNARRYGGGEIRVRAGLEDDQVVVRVEDDGPGIDPTERESIFARGTRGTASRGVEGSGLGLYVSARLMREQGGEIRLEDRPSGGACFAVTLVGFSELAPDEVAPEEALQQVDEVGDLVAHREFVLVPFPTRREQGARGAEHEDGVRHDVVR